MSRVIVKNLPKNITEEKVRDHFKSIGIITDCSLKYAKDGTFRRFAFLGFKAKADGDKAVEKFNKTYIKTSRLQIELARDFDIANKPKTWSKYTPKVPLKKPEKPAEVKKNDTDRLADSILKELEGDEDFAEFLQSTVKGKTDWANEGSKKTTKKQKGEEVEEEATEVKKSDLDILKSRSGEQSMQWSDTDDSSDSEGDTAKQTSDAQEDRQDVYAYQVKIKGLPKHIDQQALEKLFDPVKLTLTSTTRNRRKRNNAGADTVVATIDVFSEKDVTRVLGKNKSTYENEKIYIYKGKKRQLDASKESATTASQELPEDVEPISESGRIYVRNLPYSSTEEELDEIFKRFGPLTEVHLPIDKRSKQNKGFAFITYMIPEHAVLAFNALDGTVFQGRMMHLIPAMQKEETGEEESQPTNFRQQRQKEAKKTASSAHNWNSLFLGPNAVAETLASKYGITKADLLSNEAKDSLGVRIALGESQIVSETRQFLTEHGVVLDAFGQTDGARSRNVILVKNLPSGTDHAELRSRFAKFGDVTRVVLPPAGVAALVEMDTPVSARAAFSELAYTKIQNVPMYLEWAPAGAFKPPAESQEDDARTKERDELSQKDEATNVASTSSVTHQGGCTVFVKNLSFSSTEENIKEHFSSVPGLVEVTIAKKKDLKHGQLLSMGYGFVSFATDTGANDAIVKLQGSILDGHTLELKKSTRAPKTKQKSSHNVKQSAEQPDECMKILIRNIPFEASKKEIKDLFSVFGELRYVRLPQKPGTQAAHHRGFGFVEFCTKEGAKAAFTALSGSTHLYGRRLVLEWAAQTQTVDQLRAQTSRHVSDAPRKKLKKSDLMETLDGGAAH